MDERIPNIELTSGALEIDLDVLLSSDPDCRGSIYGTGYGD